MVSSSRPSRALCVEGACPKLSNPPDNPLHSYSLSAVDQQVLILKIGASRAGSPEKEKADPVDLSKYVNPPTVQEIIDALPPRPEGVSLKKFITTFKSRLSLDGQPGLMPQKVFLKLVNSCSVYSKEDKLLRRKAE